MNDRDDRLFGTSAASFNLVSSCMGKIDDKGCGMDGQDMDFAHHVHFSWAKQV